MPMLQEHSSAQLARRVNYRAVFTIPAAGLPTHSNANSADSQKRLEDFWTACSPSQAKLQDISTNFRTMTLAW